MNRIILLLALSALILWVAPSAGQSIPPTTQPAVPTGGTGGFADRVDLTPLETIAVHSSGRVKSFESFARSILQEICGGRPIRDQPPVFTYLDLMLHPGHYDHEPLIFIKMKLMRVQIGDALLQTDDITADDRQRIIKTGLVPPHLMNAQPVHFLIARWKTDLVRTAKKADTIENALTLRDSRVLQNILRPIPPPPELTPELSTEQINTTDPAPSSRAMDQPWLSFGALQQKSTTGVLSPAEQLVLAGWTDLIHGWANHDADQVNAAAVSLAATLPTVNPALYPASARLGWESWYFQSRNMTWVWLIYALSSIFLIFHIAFHWKPALWLGLTTFLIAFGFHTFAVMLRWYVSGRWPNTNMFEAITTAAWFGGCFAVLIEPWLRRMPLRGLIALGSAIASTTALMAVHFLPLTLSAGIGNRMPVLHDVWLYIHTNVIIFSYCLIFMAAISAGLYLIYRFSLYLRDIEGGVMQYARVGGAGSVIMTRPTGGSYLSGEKTTFGQMLDGVTMILMELSFILLWTGLVMGAIWADHSWGRPWGWDPKEVFALNTFLIFAVLVHTRLKVKDKGLWTAILAVIGCAVMLFNWIIINFAISGLHSYAS